MSAASELPGRCALPKLHEPGQFSPTPRTFGSVCKIWKSSCTGFDFGIRRRRVQRRNTTRNNFEAKDHSCQCSWKQNVCVQKNMFNEVVHCFQDSMEGRSTAAGEALQLSLPCCLSMSQITRKILATSKCPCDARLSDSDRKHSTQRTDESRFRGSFCKEENNHESSLPFNGVLKLSTGTR